MTLAEVIAALKHGQPAKTLAADLGCPYHWICGLRRLVEQIEGVRLPRESRATIGPASYTDLAKQPLHRLHRDAK